MHINELQSRRAALFDKMEDESFALVFAGKPKCLSADQDYPFESNRNFFYLTGINQEGSSLLLIKRGAECREFLFISPYDETKEKWYGKKLTPEEAKLVSGVNNVLLTPYLTSRLDRLLRQGIDEEVPLGLGYFDLSPELKIEEELDVKGFVGSLRAIYPSLKVIDLAPMVFALRAKKSEAEVNCLKKAIEHTKAGLLRAYSLIAPGAYEYELSLGFYQASQSSNALGGLSFPSIVASGENGTTLHYPNPQSKLKEGDLVLFDVGAKEEGYCGDISRTIPVDGVYSPRQRQLYEIVLGCNKAVIGYAKPGITLRELNAFARDYLAKRCLQEKVISTYEDIDRIYFHSVSHHIGLDDHDPMDRDKPLEEGNVISDEPGLYIKEEGIGIRIEDDLLITDRGAKNLSSFIPKEIEEIEHYFAAGR